MSRLEKELLRVRLESVKNGYGYCIVVYRLDGKVWRRVIQPIEVAG